MTTITKQGQNLLAKVNAGQMKLDYSKAVLSADSATADSTALNAIIKTDILVTGLADNSVNLTAKFDNKAITKATPYRSVGWYVKNGDSDVLFAVSDVDGVLDAGVGGQATDSQTFNMSFTVSNAKEVTVTTPPQKAVDEDSVEALIADKADRKDLEDLAKQSDVDKKADVDDVVSDKKELQSNIDKKANADYVVAQLKTKADKDDVDAKEAELQSSIDANKSSTDKAVSDLSKTVSDNYKNLDTRLQGVYSMQTVDDRLNLKADKKTVDDLTTTVNSNKASADQSIKDLSDTVANNKASADKSIKDLSDTEASDKSALEDEISTKANSKDVYDKDTVDTKLSGKANNIDVGNLERTKADKTTVESELTKKADKTDLDSKVDKTTYSENMATKADSADVDKKLATKADLSALGDYVKTSDVTTELNGKVDVDMLGQYAKSADVDQKLAGKADTKTLDSYDTTADVDKKLADKANTKDVNTELSKKVNVTDYQTGMSGKADKSDTYTKEQVDAKKSDSDSKIATAQSTADSATTKADAAQNTANAALPKAGGAMNEHATINFNGGNAVANKDGNLGGIYWTGATDWIHLFGENASQDNLDLVADLGDDGSSHVSFRFSGKEKAGINSAGVYTGTVDWSHINNKPDVATNSEVNTKANSSDVYTKAEVDSKLKTHADTIATKANSSDVYTKSQVDSKTTTLQNNINTKADSSTVTANKQDADSKITSAVNRISALETKSIGTATDINTVTTYGKYKMTNMSNTNTPSWLSDHRGQLLVFDYDGNAKTQIWIPVGTGASGGGDIGYRYWEHNSYPEWSRLINYQNLINTLVPYAKSADVLPKAGGTMNSGSIINWNSAIANGSKGTVGKIQWSGATDTAAIYGDQDGSDNLDLAFDLGDDGSNHFSFRNRGSEVAAIQSNGHFTGTIDWSHVNGKPSLASQTDLQSALNRISALETQLNSLKSTVSSQASQIASMKTELAKKAETQSISEADYDKLVANKQTKSNVIYVMNS